MNYLKISRISFFAGLALLWSAFSHAAVVRQSSVTAPSGEAAYRTAVIDSAGSFAYFASTGPIDVSDHQFNFISKLNIGTFAFDSSLGVSSAVLQGIDIAIMDPTNTYAVFGSTAVLVKVRVSDMVLVASHTLSSVGRLRSAVMDPTTSFFYLGTDGTPGTVLKMTLDNVTLVSSITLSAGNDNLTAAVIDSRVTAGYVYFASSATTNSITRIRLSDFREIDSVQLLSDEMGVASAVIDPTFGYAWFGTYDSPGKIVRVRIDPSNFSRIDRIDLNSGENQLTSAVYDSEKRRGHFGTNTVSGIVVTASLQGMSRISALRLNAGEDYLLAAVKDHNSLAYFATATHPAQVVRLDLIGGPPEILSPPASAEIAVGNDYSLSVSASGRNLTHQWFRNSAAISGATSASYTLSGVTITDDSSRFYCAVSNSSGTVNSAEAILTVRPEIHVFPNPWRADRHTGPVRFNGLPAGTEIKIFTLSGQWVKTLSETSGVASWDLRTDGGDNAASGYYFFFAKTPNDNQELTGKFALIR